MHAVDLASFLHTVEDHIIEKPICMRAKELVASRLMASRVPEAMVNERRRKAKKHAKKKGYTPSKAHLELLAWSLFLTNVPSTMWKTETIINVYPMRWQVELICKSWKSYLHVASIKTKKATPTFCYLYGRMLFMLIHDALCPQMRQNLWLKNKRELRVLKLVRHCQALAEQWMHAILQSEFGVSASDGTVGI